MPRKVSARNQRSRIPAAIASAELSSPQVAAILEISDRRVRQFVEAGYVKKTARGKYHVLEVFRGYIRFLQEFASGKGQRTEYGKERLRFMRSKADAIDIEIKQKREELVDRAKAEERVFDFARGQRDAWLHWPSRASADMATQLGVPHRKLTQVLEDAVRKHLEELADEPPTLGGRR